MTDEPESGFNNLCLYWPYRLTVRTKPSQGLNRGSIPRKVTNYPPRGGFCDLKQIENLRRGIEGIRGLRAHQCLSRITVLNFDEWRRVKIQKDYPQERMVCRCL